MFYWGLQWCIDTYVEKDRQLHYFADHGKFDGPEISSPLGVLDHLRAAAFFALFMAGNAGSLWAMYHFSVARAWVILSTVGLQLWVSRFPNVSFPGLS